ncbi:hypothetical protein D3C84_449040 [compost metagenome]
MLALDGGDQAEQQLRHQDQALGAAEDDAGEQLRPVHPAGAPDAQLALGQQGHAGAGQQRGIDPEVFQQHRQRQHGQVVRGCAGAAGDFQFVGHPQQRLGTQADAPGLPCGAGGVGDLGGAGGQVGVATGAPAPEQAIVLEAGGFQVAGEGGVGHRQAGATLLQAVGALLRAEERRQGQAGAPGEEGGQVPEQGVGTVLQTQDEHAIGVVTQQRFATLHFDQQLGIGVAAGVAAQGQGLRQAAGAFAQSFAQGFRLHGGPPSRLRENPAGRRPRCAAAVRNRSRCCR